MKQIWIIACVLLLCVGLAGCDDDPKRPSVKEENDGPAYKDLTQKWHVLRNLELAYNEMNLTEYRKIFDGENFVFFFFDDDVGGHVPAQWGFGEETICALHMFNGIGGIEDDPILSIELTLHGIETAIWAEVDPGQDFPGETWYQTIVAYEFDIDTADGRRYVTHKSPLAAFTVRELDGEFKLVRWRDLSSPGFARMSPASIKETTWGNLKALYYDRELARRAGS